MHHYNLSVISIVLILFLTLFKRVLIRSSMGLPKNKKLLIGVIGVIIVAISGIFITLALQGLFNKPAELQYETVFIEDSLVREPLFTVDVSDNDVVFEMHTNVPFSGQKSNFYLTMDIDNLVISITEVFEGYPTASNEYKLAITNGTISGLESGSYSLNFKRFEINANNTINFQNFNIKIA